LVHWDRRAGRYKLNLSGDDREVLRAVVPQFEQLLDDPAQPFVQRLYPPAYSDPAHDEYRDEYRRLMQDDLVKRHREELELLVQTADAESLTEGELLAWIRALNSLRLILGTLLGVSEDDNVDIGRSAEAHLYHWLTFLQGEAVEALSGQT
jgi:hypothetical protein